MTFPLPEHLPSREEISEVHRRIASRIHRTSILTSTAINHIAGASLWFKCENFQKVGAFKARGAMNAVMKLSESNRKNGVATHSSGNHAQALSWAAQYEGIMAHVVMPENANPVKIKAVEGYGGSITFCQPTLEARETTLKEVLEKVGATEIHPYNNLDIISGQATAAKELIEDCGAFDFLLAPVGGGGLLSGTALAAHYLAPDTPVYGAEPEMADDAFQSFKARKLIPSVNPDTIADGLRTSLGTLTFPIILNHVSDILTTSEEQIIQAMKLIWERLKIIVEPSAAVPLGVILEHPDIFRDKKIGIILSGGNPDLSQIPWNQ
jgi:threonine dehydratase